MIRKLSLALACSLALTGCVQNYAQRDVAQGASPGSLLVLNAPQGATVYVDGRPFGAVGTALGPLTPGRHEVSIEVEGRRVHAQSIFVAPGARAEVHIP